MPGNCRNGDLVFMGSLLACIEPEAVRCDETANYLVTIASDTGGFVIEMRVPMCAVHEASATFNSGYVRTTKLRAPQTT